MSIILSDDSQFSGRFLPVLSPRQNQGLGVSGRRNRDEIPEEASNRSFDIETAEDSFFQDGVSSTGLGTPREFTYDGGGQQYQGDFREFATTVEVDPAEAAATYQENSQAPFEPFYLGAALDLVG